MGIHSIDFAPRMLYEALGYKNIEVDSIAFAEQIKNSYDAKAKNITLDFSDYNKGKISITDDGIGMNERELKENWLLVGTQSKVSDENALGGKGIGRFSLFRIANSITVISKKENDMEFELSLKKNVLENFDSIQDFKVKIIENKNPKTFNNNKNSGTKIILTDLKKIDFHEIFEDLYNLIQPDFLDEFPVKINYIYPDFFNKPSILNVNKAIQYPPFFCKTTFRENYLVSYNYKCVVNGNILYENRNPKNLADLFSELPHINLGTVDFYLYNYYFHNRYVNLLDIPKNDLQNNFLNIYQGISVYRKKFKIYGHGKTDWLKLAEQRVNAPSKKIDNKLSFGYAILDRPHSDLLEEKTSREGFLKGHALNYFTSAINLIIDTFNEDRKNSIKIIRKNNFTKIIDIVEGSDNKNKTDNDIQTIKNNEKCPNKDIDLNDNMHSQTTPFGIESNTDNPGADVTDTVKEKPTIKPKPAYSKKTIIDGSFTCPNTAPEKIKRIIFELQTIESNLENAQGLLLRCLIDISTKYAQTKLNITPNSNNLASNITSILDYHSNKKQLNHKHIRRIRDTIKKSQSFILYLNGVAHEYDYRPNYSEIKEYWNIFEPYVRLCTNQ